MLGGLEESQNLTTMWPPRVDGGTTSVAPPSTKQGGQYHRLEGETLAMRLARTPRLLPQAVVGFGVALLEALVALHATGALHGAIAPENVFVGRTEGKSFVKLLRHAHCGPGYLPPEQLRGSDHDARSEVYCVGVLLYASLAGRLPWTGTSSELAARIAAGDSAPLAAFAPEVDPRLRDIVEKAITPEPWARYASARAMLEALVAWRDEASRLDGLLADFLEVPAVRAEAPTGPPPAPLAAAAAREAVPPRPPSTPIARVTHISVNVFRIQPKIVVGPD